MTRARGLGRTCHETKQRQGSFEHACVGLHIVCESECEPYLVNVKTRHKIDSDTP